MPLSLISSTYINIHMYIHMYILSRCIYIWMYISLYIYIYMYVRIFVCKFFLALSTFHLNRLFVFVKQKLKKNRHKKILFYLYAHLCLYFTFRKRKKNYKNTKKNCGYGWIPNNNMRLLYKC